MPERHVMRFMLSFFYAAEDPFATGRQIDQPLAIPTSGGRRQEAGACACRGEIELTVEIRKERCFYEF